MTTNISELKQILDAWAVERGIMPAPDAPQPANAKQLAAHNTEVTREQKSALTLEKNVTAFKAALTEKIAPAALPADMPVLEMVKLARKLGLTVPPALMDITDDEPRAVDAAGVVLPVAHGAPLASVTRTGVQLDDGLYLVEHDEKTGRYRFDLYTNGNGMFKPGKTENSAGRDFCNVHNARADVARIGDATLRMTTRMWLERPSRAK